MRSIRSRSIFLKINESNSITVHYFNIEKSERSKIEDPRSKDQKIKRSNTGTMISVGNLIISFRLRSNQSLFVIERSITSWKRSNHSCQPLLKINRIDSLTVDLFKRSKRAIRSRSIFLKDQREQFDHCPSFLKIKKIKRLKNRIPNPGK